MLISSRHNSINDERQKTFAKTIISKFYWCLFKISFQLQRFILTIKTYLSYLMPYTIPTFQPATVNYLMEYSIFFYFNFIGICILRIIVLNKHYENDYIYSGTSGRKSGLETFVIVCLFSSQLFAIRKLNSRFKG